MNYINYPGTVNVWLSEEASQDYYRKEDFTDLLSPYELPHVSHSNPYKTNSLDAFLEHHLMLV